jgi:hypothetical protein
LITHIVSVDLGQAQDYSALAVLRRIWTWPGKDNRMPFDPVTSELRHEVPLLIRWPIESEYPIIVNQIVETYHLIQNEVDADGVALIVDRGGPGRPIVDYLRRKKLRPIGITIQAGNSVNERAEDDLTCPKKDIVSALVYEAQSGWVKIAKNLEWARELENELGNFGYKIKRDTGTVSYEAQQERVHDDLVVTLAAGLWYSRTMLPQRLSGAKGGNMATVEDTDYNPL